VSSHACATLSNFLEGATSEDIIGDKLEDLIQTVGNLVQEASLHNRENAAILISTVAEASPNSFRKYFQQTVTFLFDVLKQLEREDENLEVNGTSKFVELRGSIIESITSCSIAIGIDEFKEHQEVQKDLMSVLTSESCLKQELCAFNYVISSWSRISTFLGADFSPYSNSIISMMLKRLMSLPIEDDDS